MYICMYVHILLQLQCEEYYDFVSHPNEKQEPSQILCLYINDLFIMLLTM